MMTIENSNPTGGQTDSKWAGNTQRWQTNKGQKQADAIYTQKRNQGRVEWAGRNETKTNQDNQDNGKGGSKIKHKAQETNDYQNKTGNEKLEHGTQENLAQEDKTEETNNWKLKLA